MTRAEGGFWARKAQEGQESGWASPEEVRRLFTKMIDAADKGNAKRTEKSGEVGAHSS